jgi:hypothetical protein
VQKPALADPLFLVDNNPVHDSDLTGRTAETQRGDAEPNAEGFSQRDAVFGRCGRMVRCG